MALFGWLENQRQGPDLALKSSQALGLELTRRGALLAVAESCTGGLIAHLLTNVPGSSDWFVGGAVAYANSVKTMVLSVPEGLIAAHGAVSREVVLAMAHGVRDLMQADMALAVSGITGPGGGSPEKPVGTAWVAWVAGEAACCECFLFSGTRLQIKKQAAVAAIAGMFEMLNRYRAGSNLPLTFKDAAFRKKGRNHPKKDY